MKLPNQNETMSVRNSYRQGSNNPQNPNKNLCALRVCEALQVADEVRYLHVMKDIVRAARMKWKVRSCKSAFPKITTVDSLKFRQVCSKLATMKAYRDNEEVVGYLIETKGHVSLYNADGTAHTNTDMDFTEGSRIISIYTIVSPPSEFMTPKKRRDSAMRELIVKLEEYSG